jgi:hypothetical protein
MYVNNPTLNYDMMREFQKSVASVPVEMITLNNGKQIIVENTAGLPKSELKAQAEKAFTDGNIVMLTDGEGY